MLAITQKLAAIVGTLTAIEGDPLDSTRHDGTSDQAVWGACIKIAAARFYSVLYSCLVAS